ncbi:actin polymerization protein Bzz1 [Polychaeton citri CBS 116435]|uniref:Protein BZZ1 n=1 Tax=Polychaeton citri CBS 116435 TaxID=1314669 RepID=A0A9P4QEJ1_9PEZI|nr:actin polymerization protein Bzz1 [Polychaeton citri CBS 116435]
MAEVNIAPNFGAELKDGFKPVNAWVTNGITFLEDIQTFYRERSAIEKEYSQKLNVLAKKYFERKAKKQSTLSVGDTPTVTPGSLESASMTTWTVQLTTLESRAAEHEQFSQNLIGHLAEPLKNLQGRYEELRKQHAEYAAKLEKEREGSYADLKKTKGKYDSVCAEVESKRKKAESSLDKNKAQNTYNTQVAEMKNVKNTYLISINVTNKQKERYYHEYVPDLLDSLQSLSESRVAILNGLWQKAAGLETETLSRSGQLLTHLSSEIPRNNPVLDSMMFVRHNASQWADPPDFGFEPSPVWLDDDVMAADARSKTFLMNILTKSKASLGELRRECDIKKREVEGAKRVRQAIREGKDKRDEVEVVRSLFYLQEQLHEAERRRVTAEVEVSTILTSVGDVSLGARNHQFKQQTYKIPTNCDLCGDRLWGLSAKGLACVDCGFVCHTKCELRVPAECPGELDKTQQKALKARRQEEAQARTAAPAPEPEPTNGASRQSAVLPSLQRTDTISSMNTLSSGYAASAHRSTSNTTARSGTLTTTDEVPASGSIKATPPRPRVMAPPPAHYIKDDGVQENGHSDLQKGKMLYAYQANGDGEISLAEGTEINIVEPDDGSGWIKVQSTNLGAPTGLVPASYAELSPFSSAPAALTRPVSQAASASTASLAESISAASGKPKRVGPAVAPRRAAAKKTTVKYVDAMYTYDPSGDGETAMEEGERMILVTPDQGDGWCEVESRAGRGVVPSGWIREV